MRFKRPFAIPDTLKGWWPSLYQSVENPLQPDRLRDTAGIELEYPAVSESPAAARRHTLFLLALGGLAGLIPSIVEQFRNFYHLTPYLLAIAATVAAYYFLSALPPGKHKHWRWPLYFLGFPLFFVALVVLREPYLILGLAMLLCLPAADLFATHYFYRKTTAPMPKERSRRLRALWQNRNRPLAPHAPGVELYPLAWATIPVVFVILFCFSRRPATGVLMANFPLIAWAVGLLLFVPLLVEALASFIYARKCVSPPVIVRAFRAAVVSWFTYNRKGTVAPGVFQSPAGPYVARRRMSLALIVLFATAILQLFSLERDKLAQLDVHFKSERSRQMRPLEDLLDDFRWDPKTPLETPPPDRNPALPNLDGLPSSSFWRAFPSLDLASTAQAATPAPPAAGPETDMQIFERLEPYQRGRVQRMSPEERERYFEKLRQSQPAAEPEADPKRTESYQDLIDRSSVRLFSNFFAAIPAAFFRAVYPLVCFLLPPLCFLACCFSASARVVGYWGREMGTSDSERLFSTKTWEDLVARVQNCEDKKKKTLILGVNAFDDTPVIVPREIFSEHAHLLGDSGSGKTALGLASLIAQFIRFGDVSVVVIDLKGDDAALLEGARIEAEKKGLPFRWFTNELDRSSYVFNPLTQKHFQTLSFYQRADILATSMGLEYGTDYGRSYFGDANVELLHKALEANPKLATFNELYRILLDKGLIHMDRELRRAASHSEATVSRLAQCEALSPSEKHVSKDALEHAIELSDVFVKPQVLYFSFPSALGTTYSASIARLVLYSLLAAAKYVGPKRGQVYLFIDEFQRIAAHNLELVLQTARSMNIGVILANQSLKDLDAPGSNLISTVRTNTRYKQVFAASDLFEQQELMQGGGETVVLSRSWTGYMASTLLPAGVASAGATETVTPRLRPNDILLATDDPFQSIVCIRRGKDYAQFGGMPFVMTSAFHIEPDEYERRRKAAWPDRPAETHTAHLRPPEPKPADEGGGVEQALSRPKSRSAKPLLLGDPGAMIQTPAAKEQPEPQEPLPPEDRREPESSPAEKPAQPQAAEPPGDESATTKAPQPPRDEPSEATPVVSSRFLDELYEEHAQSREKKPPVTKSPRRTPKKKRT